MAQAVLGPHLPRPQDRFYRAGIFAFFSSAGAGGSPLALLVLPGAGTGLRGFL